MKITYAGSSEAGSREENQDCIFCASKGSAGVFLVADGMGGHQDGALASRCIRNKIRKTWEDGDESGFAKALEEANTVIRSLVPKGSVCGSTVVLLQIGPKKYELFGCGDSHAYLLEKTLFGIRMKQLGPDDVWENDAANTQGLTRQEILLHKNHGKLLRAVGTQEELKLHRVTGRLRPGQLFVLTSDGIYKYIETGQFEKELKEALKNGSDLLMDCVERLQDMVYRAGAPDNLSVILVYLEKE